MGMFSLDENPDYLNLKNLYSELNQKYLDLYSENRDLRHKIYALEDTIKKLQIENLKKI